jgi:hypothetical protein
MEHNLIDTDLFSDGLEPWPNQVFKKDFDAYFLLDYPAYQYCPNEDNIFDPFDLMNNLSEKTVFISSVSGKSNLTHTIDNEWNRQLYYNAYKKNITKERFLFWEGEGDKWAMASDAKCKVAIIGIDWKIAGEVAFFFPQCLLSPIQFLEKVGKQKHLDVFMKNYQPTRVLIEGSVENPMWVKYFFECHVENENDKLFYWPQFEKIFNAIYPLLKHFKSLDMYAEQGFNRRYWQNKQWYSSGKNAPIGGWQKYNYKNCEKIANKFLNDNEHLRFKFEGKKEASDALYIASGKKGLIEFYSFWIYASLLKMQQKGSKSDFYFLTTLHSFGNKNDKYNQNFNFSYRKELFQEMDIENLVEQLGEIGFAIKIHKAEKPYINASYYKDKPLCIESIYGDATVEYENIDYLIQIK